MAAKTGNVFKAGQELQKIIGKGLWLFPLLRQYYPSLVYLFFNENDMKNKSLKQKFLPIEATTTEDGKSMLWYDYNMFDVEYDSVADIASTSAINLQTLTGDADITSEWFEAGDQILLVRKEWTTRGDNVKLKITSISGTDNEVLNVSGWPVVIDKGDRIIRLYYTQAEEAEIERGASTYAYKEYKSLFQNFGRVLSFTKTDLNKHYFFEKDAKNYVVQKIGVNINILLQEFINAIWFGSNTVVSTPQGPRPEMLGIDTAIKEVYITDKSVIVDFAGLTDDDDKIELLTDAIESTFATGAIPANEKVSVACNQRWITKMSRMKHGDIVYNDKFDGVEFKLFTIKNAFGNNIEFFHEPRLDRTNKNAVAYILPRSLMALKFREFQNLDENQNFVKAKWEVNVVRRIENIHDKARFDCFFEAATVLGGLSTSVYKKLINL